MPFTLSHAAAVLPAIRRRGGTGRGALVASGLVAGSLAPDLTYFTAGVLPGAMEFGQFTHSPTGVVTVDVLCAALLAGGWLLLREPLVALLPAARQGRVYGLLRGESWHRRGRLALAGWFWVSAVLGALTHVVWDSFTHPGRAGVRALPALAGQSAGFPRYLWLQYGTSALALLVLLWYLAGALRRTPDRPAPAAVPRLGSGARAAALLALALAGAAGAGLRLARFFSYVDHVETPLDLIPTLCFGAGAGIALALPVYAALIRYRHRPRGGADTGTGQRPRTPVAP
ncbi:DUF4184 family protein [Streptomyces sp. NPDC089919]|uniref:DUF4184 family protein n=1 Tax=Streptomyces sp. NPDC089919 TaxID=3155188 RepID=UPI0034314118